MFLFEAHCYLAMMSRSQFLLQYLPGYIASIDDRESKNPRLGINEVVFGGDQCPCRNKLFLARNTRLRKPHGIAINPPMHDALEQGEDCNAGKLH